MHSDSRRGLRIGLIAILAIGVTASVVLSLEKSGGIVDIPPINETAYPASECLDASVAQWVQLEGAAGAQYLSLYGAIPGGLPGTLPGHDPVPDTWTVRFLDNGDGPSKGGPYPGSPLLLTPLGGGDPVTADFIVPGNLTPTGELVNTVFGLEDQQHLDLDIPDVILPAGDIWVEVFQNYGDENGTHSKTCSPWLWQTGHPGNNTYLFALDIPPLGDDDDFVDKTAPGTDWDVVQGAVSLLIGGATTLDGACCTDGPGTASDCIETTRADCETNHSLFLGEGSLCDAQTIECEMLVVEFDSVDVKAVREGVRIDWTTSLEVDTAGFRVLRETGDRREKSVTPVSGLIHSVGAGLGGGSYTFLDNAADSRRASAYYIDDLDLSGRWTRHGPFPVQRKRQTEPVFDSRSAGQR